MLEANFVIYCAATTVPKKSSMQKWEYLRIVVNMDEREVDDVTVNDVKIFDQDEQRKPKEVELVTFRKTGLGGLGTGQWLGKPVVGSLLLQASGRLGKKLSFPSLG